MALATLAQIRAGLKTRLDTISGLQTYAYLPATPTMPCAFIGVGDGTDIYHDAMQTGVVTWPMRVWVLVSAAVPSEESQADADLFVSPTGASSIKLALEGASTPQTLVGVVSDVVVDGFTEPQTYVTEQGSYWGVQFAVRVHTNN